MSWSTTVNLQKLAGTCNYGACIYYNTSDLSIVAMLMNKAIIAFPVHYSAYYTVCKLTNCVSCYSTDYLRSIEKLTLKLTYATHTILG